MFKKNTAVTGFSIGHFINATTGAAVTTGTPTCKRMLDGTGAACANAAAYNADGAQWEIDLAAADTNGDMVGLSFTLTDCLPISYSFRTTAKLVSELNDLSAANVNTEADLALADAGVTTTRTGYLDAAISSRSTLAAGAAMTLTSAYDAAKTASSLTAQQVWEYATRDLSSFGTLVADIATAVWGAVARTITGTVTTDSASREASKADVSTLATATNVTDATAAIRGATGTETLDTLAADIAAASAPTVQQIDTELTANHGAGLWTSAATGSGDIYVTAATLDDTGDDMTFKTAGGAGIGGAVVKAFVTAEYTAGTFTVRGTTTTVDSGAWLAALMLNAGVQYTIEFSKDGYTTATTTVTPSA